MAAGDPETEAQIEKALKSFCCFLYVGNDRPWYKAKPWNDDDHYLQGERMRTLEILASNKKTELIPIDKIKLAMDSKLIRRPETVMFALAMCARQKKSEKLAAAAYYFLAEHCPEWKYFILFINYASYLCRAEGSKDRDKDKDDGKKPIGWGRGWKNAVNKWYLTKSVTDLCELVTKHKGDHGWTHKDILKLSHPETCGLDVEKQAILCYVMKGLEAAEKEYNNDAQAKSRLSYIRLIESCKRCQDKDAVIETIKTARHPLNTIDYVHPMALKHKEVWSALLETMDIRTILKHLPKLNQWRLLTKDGPAIPVIVKALTTESNIKWNEIQPIEILRLLNRYETPPTKFRTFRMVKSIEEMNKKSKKPKSQSGAKGKSHTNTKNNSKSAQTRKRLSEPKVPDVRIRDALRTALAISQTVDITKSSKTRYLISVRFPGRRGDNQCVETALALTLPLFHRSGSSEDSSPCRIARAYCTDELVERFMSRKEEEKHDDPLPDDTVTIFGYTPTAHGYKDTKIGQLIPITKKMSFDEALNLLVVPLSRRDELLSLPYGVLTWAMGHRKKYDVFINITNEPPKIEDLKVMKYYKTKMELPEARFINVVISRVPFELKEEIWKDTLIVNGFDVYVPWIIEAYVRGLF